MQSFRSELENPVVEQEIVDLERKIRLFQEGKIHEEKFRSLRLARGVYGQRQKGVQMVRIKLPFGRLTFRQWARIADVSDEYSTGNLHLTTRQDVQLHFVSLDRTPELWARLAQDDITLREACGNTVRNVTASPTAGIDPQEPFDVSPHAAATFRYFLRNPICQELGRKFKIAFSSSEADTALTYLHDLGFVPRLENGRRGFRVLIGGGLGAQPHLAEELAAFLPEERLMPTIEATLRVFDRHGERNSRHKARLKFLLQKIGLEALKRLIAEEETALPHKTFPIENAADGPAPAPAALPQPPANAPEGYASWLATNVFPQKQNGLFGVFVRVPLGNLDTARSRRLVAGLEPLVADDVRVTINQGLLLRGIGPDALPAVYAVLAAEGLARPGANSTANITACPGTDTCNLGISDSTSVSLTFEQVMQEEFPDLIHNHDILIKISGCMNACGQHNMAQIGFHGSSLKAPDKRVLPALQVLLGGGTLGGGQGRISDKVIKIPSKRGPVALRWLFQDYEQNAAEGEYFNTYYDRQGEKYFYHLLKPLADLSTLENGDFIDWGQDDFFETEIGVGECAGVVIDLVATLLFEADEKLAWAETAYNEGRFADSLYHAYSVYVSAAKALLLDKGVNASSQHGILKAFDTEYVATGDFAWAAPLPFSETVLSLNKQEPSQAFAETFLQQAAAFAAQARAWRQARRAEAPLPAV